ncbi:mannose-1-phosphate guanylyltransferase/mannose-6-phosphate isomerase [Aestuariirhabdus sp. LZHN29]|uniref:mannose-1-phosphate guanylyltransferase/mannose-6-phosphate isomerase n=1 Tax=Aestuariirhabdus sp. LZHN29 TaxID=3417462 RepID=UPI003CF81C64
MLMPVIMSGGSGTRLWPASRRQKPKQFLPLVNSTTLFQDTVQRLEGVPALGNPLVICNEDHRFMAAEQLRELNIAAEAILLEPVGRNTAPAVALAALHACQSGDDPLLLVLAADHVIENQSAFHQAIAQAVKAAENGALVTFGIVPSAPETGYGYIQTGGQLDASGSMAVQKFVEKPDAETAQSYLDSGEYLWNSGMFLFRASSYLEELNRYRPDIMGACRKALGTERGDLDFVRVDHDAFAACPDDSIDYAVMENTALARVVPLDAGWNDVGSWSALWDIGSKDQFNNTSHGDVVSHDTSNSMIYATKRLVTTVGVDNLIVVETTDAVMVADKNRVQDVKAIVNSLKAEGRPEVDQLVHVYRPWGHYESIASGDRYQVKHILVKPGEKLSVQLHHHRAEHWVVVSGTARVTCGEQVSVVAENESVYIPIGEVHALENPGKIPLELIEVQSGSYLGEDDIVRFSDLYNRV